MRQSFLKTKRNFKEGAKKYLLLRVRGRVQKLQFFRGTTNFKGKEVLFRKLQKFIFFLELQRGYCTF